jgi:hypothetical protein
MSILNSIRNALFPKTAAHEVGHALLASHVGFQVHSVQLLHGGRAGVTNFKGHADPLSELQVIVAGFVAEELAGGNTSPYTGFNQPQYAQDRIEAYNLIDNDPECVQRAIQLDVEYLTRPEIKEYSKYLVNLLDKKGELSGDLFKVP